MLHQPTPPVHPPEPTQRLDDRDPQKFSRLLDSLRGLADNHGTLAVHIEDVKPQSSPVGDIDQRVQALKEAVCCLQKKLLDANLAPGDLVPLDLGNLLKISELETFYDRNREAGQEGGLNALFADKFILNNSEAPSTTIGFIQKGVKVLQAWAQASAAGQSGRISKEEADRLAEKYEREFCAIVPAKRTPPDPRQVQDYQNMKDTPYDQSFASIVSNGSFASVRMVRHKRTKEELAMKTFSTESDKAQILREIGILEVCDHPNILKFVEAFTVTTEDGQETVNIVMSPWAPFTLRGFLGTSDEKRRAQCPWFQPGSPQSDLCIYRIMQQLAEAIAYLHSRSIKHKDIKPDNILLHEPASTPPRPIVADVGISKVLVRGGSTKYIDSSYQYLAPEQVAKKDSKLPADVWQLGCCFAMLLAVSKAGTLGNEKLWDSFWRSGGDCSCQIAGEHEHFMRSFEEIYSPTSQADRAAYSLVSSMLNLDHEARINIEGVLASVKDLIRLASEDEAPGVTMAG